MKGENQYESVYNVKKIIFYKIMEIIIKIE